MALCRTGRLPMKAIIEGRSGEAKLHRSGKIAIGVQVPGLGNRVQSCSCCRIDRSEAVSRDLHHDAGSDWTRRLCRQLNVPVPIVLEGFDSSYPSCYAVDAVLTSCPRRTFVFARQNTGRPACENVCDSDGLGDECGE